MRRANVSKEIPRRDTLPVAVKSSSSGVCSDNWGRTTIVSDDLHESLILPNKKSHANPRGFLLEVPAQGRDDRQKN